IALRAQSTRHRASRCETVRSLLMRFSVSSTIIRTRRRRRRSKNAESGSVCDSYSNFGIVVTRRKPGVCGVNSNGGELHGCRAVKLHRGRAAAKLCRCEADLRVLAIAFGPDLFGELRLD